jgi:hypothetical protein
MNRLSVFILCCCLSGCASEPAARKRVEPRVKPELVLLVPDEPAALAPTSAPTVRLPNQQAVLIAPDVIIRIIEILCMEARGPSEKRRRNGV